MFKDSRIPVRFVEHVPSSLLPPSGGLEALLLPRDTPLSLQAALARKGWAVVRELPEIASRFQSTPAQQPGVHPPACSCCAGRAPAAVAMLALFQARARGEVAFFQGVTASLRSSERALLDRLVADDPLVSACFRLGQAA